MNLSSSQQLSTFLFGGAENTKTKEPSERMRVFRTPRVDIPDEAMEAYRDAEQMKKENDAADDGSQQPNNHNTLEEDEFDKMKVAELKVLCKEYGLKVSGKKAELQQRLRGHFQMRDNPEISCHVDDYDSMSVQDLRDACKTRCLDATGKTKAVLIKELQEDDSMTREILSAQPNAAQEGGSSMAYRRISELLEEAVASGESPALKAILSDLRAKDAEEPKYVDVKITSLEMTPDKFTAGGSPSATADVLRKLAGDPFADPPMYGKVEEAVTCSAVSLVYSFFHCCILSIYFDKHSQKSNFVAGI